MTNQNHEEYTVWITNDVACFDAEREMESLVKRGQELQTEYAHCQQEYFKREKAVMYWKAYKSVKEAIEEDRKTVADAISGIEGGKVE